MKARMRLDGETLRAAAACSTRAIRASGMRRLTIFCIVSAAGSCAGGTTTSMPSKPISSCSAVGAAPLLRLIGVIVIRPVLRVVAFEREYTYRPFGPMDETGDMIALLLSDPRFGRYHADPPMGAAPPSRSRRPRERCP